MRVAASDISLSGQHAAVQRHEVRERLRAWVGARPGAEGTRANDSATISSEARRALGQSRASAPAAQKAEAAAAATGEGACDPKYLVLKMIIEQLTGRKMRLVSASDAQPPSQTAAPPAPQPAQAARPAAGFGVEYDRHEEQYEAERTTFTAEGVIRTTDGQELRFRITLEMSREFRQQQDIAIRLGDAARQAQDPLVINFGGTAAQLTGARFAFDLNADGIDEQVPVVGPQSALLALDLNGDARVNDGTELFGPRTGDGFAELAAYDSDRNGWIDEADPVYAQLSLWTRDAEGNDVLQPLEAGGVGAIYLGRIATPFDLKDGQNALLGQTRSTGLYAGTDGTVGTIQQLDLVA